MFILINNIIYDITNFQHPGRSVIQTHYWTNENQIDATEIFYAFHPLLSL